MLLTLIRTGEMAWICCEMSSTVQLKVTNHNYGWWLVEDPVGKQVYVFWVHRDTKVMQKNVDNISPCILCK